MFGKPDWFRAKALGWGLIPICWQGWLYTGSWAAAVALPFLLLVSRRQPIEAMVWLTALGLGLSYDVWQIVRALKRSQDAGTAARSGSAA